MTMRRAAAVAFATGVALAPLGSTAAPPAQRIVSLMPSLTEDLFAIGAGPQVVGVSEYANHPAAAARLPRVNSFASADAERILRLHPDLVVGIPAQRGLVADIRRLGLRVVLISNDGYADIFADLRALGALSGHGAAAEALAARLRARTAALVRSVQKKNVPRCLVVLGVSPVYTVGNGSYLARLLAMAGGKNAASDLRSAYGRYGEEAVIAADPDVIVADRASGLADVLGRAPWNALRAVRSKRVYILDDADILEVPGPRYNDGLAWLIARLHGPP